MKDIRTVPEKIIKEVKTCPFCLEQVSIKDNWVWESHLRKCDKIRDKIVACIESASGISHQSYIALDHDGDPWFVWWEDYHDSDSVGISPATSEKVGRQIAEMRVEIQNLARRHAGLQKELGKVKAFKDSL